MNESPFREQFGKKKDYLFDQMDGLVEAYSKVFPGDEILICARVVANDEEGNPVHDADMYVHSRIKDIEFKNAIYNWAALLSEGSD